MKNEISVRGCARERGRIHICFSLKSQFQKQMPMATRERQCLIRKHIFRVSVIIYIFSVYHYLNYECRASTRRRKTDSGKKTHERTERRANIESNSSRASNNNRYTLGVCTSYMVSALLWKLSAQYITYIIIVVVIRKTEKDKEKEVEVRPCIQCQLLCRLSIRTIVVACYFHACALRAFIRNKWACVCVTVWYTRSPRLIALVGNKPHEKNPIQCE